MGQHGATSLFLAACFSHLAVVRLLLGAGADKNAANQDGATALMLLEAGHKNAVSQHRAATALMAAAENGHEEVVPVKNAATGHKTTPLMFAAGNGHLELVRLLLEAGADKNAVERSAALAAAV